MLRYRAASLFLEGYTLKRGGLAGFSTQQKRRARVDAAVRKYTRK